MKSMQVQAENLSELVEKFKETRLQKKYQWADCGRTWKLYVRKEDQVTFRAYVSDADEVMASSSFKPEGSERDEQDSLTTFLGEYERYQERVVLNRKSWSIPTTLLTLGGALGGSLAIRNPVGAVPGALGGYVVSRILDRITLGQLNEEFGAYLRSHHVALGEDALDVINQYRREDHV